MRATCPQCETGYQLRDGAVAPGQRMRFQCKRCDAQVVVLGPRIASGRDAERDAGRHAETALTTGGGTGRFETVPYSDLEEAELPPPLQHGDPELDAAARQFEEQPAKVSVDTHVGHTPFYASPEGAKQPRRRASRPSLSQSFKPAPVADETPDRPQVSAQQVSAQQASAQQASAQQASAPPPIPAAAPAPVAKPEHLKPPLPKPKPPAATPPSAARPTRPATSGTWPAPRAWAAIAVALAIGFAAGVVVAVSMLGGHDAEELAPVPRRLVAPATRAAAPPMRPVEVASVEPPEPSASLDPGAVAAFSDSDAASEVGADAGETAEPGVDTEAPPPPSSPDESSGSHVDADDEADVSHPPPDAAENSEAAETPEKPEKTGRKRTSKARGRTSKARSTRSFKRRAKAALKRCDQYHRKVYKLRKAVRRGALVGDGDPADEMQALQRYVQGKGGVRMERTMADVRALQSEARESESASDQGWFARQVSVTCDKSGRYPPNP